jgi:ABC-type methionine transport system ATPase subunit
MSTSTIEVRVKLTFPDSLIRVPVLARLTRTFDVEPNIRRANVEEYQGWIICELVGAAVGVDLLGDVLEG